ncbi:hypothetical protein EPK97_14850 [Chengkuizengella sediminis]|nr:hypothetical protein [Chengkuizengella sediminis]
MNESEIPPIEKIDEIEDKSFQNVINDSENIFNKSKNIIKTKINLDTSNSDVTVIENAIFSEDEALS